MLDTWLIKMFAHHPFARLHRIYRACFSSDIGRHHGSDSGSQKFVSADSGHAEVKLLIRIAPIFLIAAIAVNGCSKKEEPAAPPPAVEAPSKSRPSDSVREAEAPPAAAERAEPTPRVVTSPKPSSTRRGKRAKSATSPRNGDTAAPARPAAGSKVKPASRAVESTPSPPQVAAAPVEAREAEDFSVAEDFSAAEESASSFPEEAAAPVAEAPLPHPSASTATGLFWNAWFELTDEFASKTSSFSPVKFLEPDKNFRLTVDLGSLAYQSSSGEVFAETTGRELVDLLRKLVETDPKRPTATVQLLLIVDETAFEAMDDATEELVIDLQKLRVLFDDPGSMRVPGDMFAVLREANGDAPFSFGRATSLTKTRDNVTGPRAAGVAVSIWVGDRGDRPVDEITFSVCLANSGTDIEKCPNSNAAQAQSFAGMDPVRLALEKSSLPTAAVHFVNVRDADTYGVLRRPVDSTAANPSPRYVSWSLGKTRDALTQDLSNWTDNLLKSRGNEAAIRMLSEALFDLLVPQEKKAARDAFLELIRNRQVGPAAPAGASLRPSMFVRWVRRSTDVTRIIPFGLAAVKDNGKTHFLGFEFRIEQPLPVQSYTAHENCLSHWALAIPAASEGDKPVQSAIKRLGSLPADWGERAAGGVFDTMPSFRNWFSGVTEPHSSPASVVAILGHHSSDAITFDLRSPPFTAGSVKRTFATPSVAILNACGTGGITTSRFVKELNERGVEAIVATSSEVDPEMAADYLLCVREQLEGNAALKNATLAEVHSEAVTCLANKETDTTVPGAKWGARGLEFVLLGNSAIRICAPKL